MALPKVVNVKLVGSAWKNGFRHSGYALVSLLNGKDVYVPEEHAAGFEPALNFVEDQADTKEMRWRVKEWVRTGEFPPVGAMEESQ